MQVAYSEERATLSVDMLSDLVLVFFTRSSQGISPQKGAIMTIFLSKLAQNSSQDSSTTTWES